MPFEHARRKDLDRLKAALPAGADVNQPGPNGETLLICACGMDFGASPSLEVVEWLLARGAAVNARSDRGFTALTEACAYGALDVVQALLDAGADPDLPGPQDQTALHKATRCEHWSDAGPALVAVLLRYGADPNPTDSHGDTPLALAAQSPAARLPCLQLLLAGGADPTPTSDRLPGPLAFAAESGHLESARLLIAAGAPLDHRHGRGGATALEAAMAKDHPALVRLLLEAGAAQPSGDSILGPSLLAYAALRGHLDLLEFVAAEPPARQVDDAWASAAAAGRIEVLHALVDRGLTLEAGSSGWGRALTDAATNGQVDAAAYLLDRGAPLDARDFKDDTALSLASLAGHEPVVSLLLDRGAARSPRNRAGRTPLHEASARGRAAVVKRLLGAGVPVDEADDADGATAVILAASEGKDAVLEVLLDAGAAPDAVAHNGRTARSWALGNGHAATVARLEQAGAAPREHAHAATSGRCAFCGEAVAHELPEDQHCPDCDATYCAQHLPWSEPYRTWFHDRVPTQHAICPYGHRQTVRGRRRRGR